MRCAGPGPETGLHVLDILARLEDSIRKEAWGRSSVVERLFCK
jgi:hypothetical protein